MSNTLHRLSELRRRHGGGAALHWLTARVLEKSLRLEVSELCWLDRDRRTDSAVAAAAHASELACRFLTPAEIAAFGADSANDLPTSLASRPTAGLDYCFGILDGGRLASYSWYALRSIEGEHHMGVPMAFPASAAYMYKAFTHPDYRGRSLYAIGVMKAFDALAGRGITSLITSVSRANFASLNACHRMGFEPLGNLWTLGAGTRRIAWTPEAARQRGIEFGDRAEVANRSVAAA